MFFSARMLLSSSPHNASVGTCELAEGRYGIVEVRPPNDCPVRMVRRPRDGVGRFPHAGCERFTGRSVLVPPLASSREFVLQLQDGDNRFDVLSRHPGHRHFVPRLIDGRLGRRDACAGDADQKGNVFRPNGRERHDPSRLAHAQQSDLRAVDIAASLQVLGGSHDIARQIVERCRVPVARRSAHTPLVVPEDRHAAPDQEPRPGKDVFPVLGARAVHENNRGVFPTRGRTDERTGQLNVAAREADVFAFLDLDTPRGSRTGTLALPRKRGDLAGAVPLKFNSRLDGRRNRHARSGEELVAVGRVQRPHLTGFVERDEFARLGEAAEFIPQLEIHEPIRFPAIYARVFTKHLLVHGAHDGSLNRRERDHRSEENRTARCADRCPRTHVPPPCCGAAH